MKHQYVDRASGSIATERLFADRILRFLYSEVRENAPALFQLLTHKRVSQLLATANFDIPLGAALLGNGRFLRSCGVDLSECLATADQLRTPRQIFERQIRYWECRPMPTDAATVVCPADSRMIVGSLDSGKLLFVKNKFFDYRELLGFNDCWCDSFRSGDFSISRLTPDKYHYTHTPVGGVVRDHYEVSGVFHSCNPSAVVEAVTPYSKNRRAVTIIDTDVSDGTGVGLVAVIEVAALMIGDIVQCYSECGYHNPQSIHSGLLLQRGAPKSLFRPGSSAVVILFQKNRIEFAGDLVLNLYRSGADSRFSHGFLQPLMETDVKVRSMLAQSRGGDS
jgi:phosphatidylserine decarboxylase